MGAEPGEQHVEIQRLDPAEHAGAVDVLARAFRDNPLNVAAVGRGPEERRRANAHTMRALLAVAPRRGRVLRARYQGHLAAVLVAAPPHGFPFPPPGWALRLRVLAGLGLRASARWATAFEVLSRLHPPEPHFYLGVLGVAPELQGRGLGRALLRHWLEEIDARSEPAYLETDRAVNVPFYQREGFEVCDETHVLGVRIWRMRRPARPA